MVNQTAPGELERVRELLNTWLIPNDTRVPTDRFADYHADDQVLRALRDDLRRVVEERDTSLLNEWIDGLAVVPRVADGKLVFRHDGSAAGEMLALVLTAIAELRWERLKACPDCRWVFYDNTRNGSKRWCLMNAGGPQGRSCGSIAKVRRHRERNS